MAARLLPSLHRKPWFYQPQPTNNRQDSSARRAGWEHGCKHGLDNVENRGSLPKIAVRVTRLAQHARQRKHADLAVMKTNLSFLFRLMTWITPLSAWAGASAAPLIWFPGPSLDAPRSGAATAVVSGGNNLLIGGDSSVGTRVGRHEHLLDLPAGVFMAPASRPEPWPTAE